MMEENRSREVQDPDLGMADDAMADDAMADDAMAGGTMADDASADEATAEVETPDRGYELDLDKHSPTDLDAAIQDAVEAVERAGHSGEAEVGGDGEAAADEPIADADQLRSELADLQERLLRTMADFDNFRKRTDREKETLRRLGASEVLRDFLSISDNLSRALESSGGVEDLKQGLQMILRQYDELLRRHGAEKVESLDQPFDPTLHEAVATRQSSEVEVPTVIEELQKGYLFHDRLLRPAMVWVAMPAAAPSAKEDGGSQTVEAEDAAVPDPEEADRVVD